MDPKVPPTPERIVVIGTSGSGKTTFARALAERLGQPHIELDELHWKPNWTLPTVAEYRERVSAAITPPRWVLDGNYSASRDIVWSRATDLIWLDYPLRVIFSRALCRTVGRILRREELWVGNRESVRRSFFSRDSILLRVLTTYHRRRREYPRLLAAPEHSHLRVVTFTLPADADCFLRRLG